MNLGALIGVSLSRDDRGIADEWVVDTRIWHQIGLELIQIDIQSTIES
jgi:hypothetical protein